jgi:gliding motility-associated-like protein
MTTPVFLSSSTYAANTTGNYYCIVTNNTTNCSFESPTQVVNVTIPGTASISYPNTSYCTTSTPQAVTLIGTPGGTYSVFPINGLLVSPSTGTITIAGATPGSYTITYTLPASGGCPAVTALANVTITANTIPLFTAVGPYCSGAIIPPLPNPSLNGIIGSWSPAINNTTTTLYTFTPTAGLGQCASPVSTTIAITPPPTITPISYSSPSYCTSTTTTQVPFGVTPGGVFSVNSTGLNAWNSATGSFVPFGSVPGVYTIYYTIGSASSTCGSVPVQAIVTITQAAAAPTISYPFIEYCKSETVQQLPSITGSGGIISVFPSSGLSINSSGIITPSSSAVGIYTITYTIPASAGCLSQTANTTITIKPIPTAPTITYSTPLIFCDGESVILSIIPTIGHTYKWWKIEGATFSGTGTSFAASTTGSYYVEITSISTTCSSNSIPVDVTVKPLPNAIISPTGPLAICAGTSTTLTAFNAAGYSFSWGASHIYQVSTAGTYNVTVSLNGCSALSDDVVVSVIPNPLPGITSSPINLQACFGQAVTLQVNNITPLSDYTFEWFSASGPSVLGTLSSYSATTSGNYYIRVTSATGSFCTAESAEVAVTIHPYIPAAITLPAGSSTTFCEGTSINLTASPLIGYNYLWSNSNTLPTINLSSPIQSGIYTVIVTNNVTGCSEMSDPVEITIHSNPSVPIILPNGPLVNCSGSTPLVLSANPSILPTYQWFLNSDPVGTNSSSHNAIATGNYTVISENVNGCLSLPSAPTYVTINPTPPAPVITTASGALVTFCQGGSIILSTTINFGSTYNWYRGTEFYASGVPLTVTESGTYQLIEITSSNCPSIPSSPKVITVIPAPTPTITANGNEEFCAYPGASVQLQATPGYSSYQWIRVTPSLVIAPQNSPNYTATTSGTYSVIGTINGCPSLASNQIPVTVNPLPNALLTASSATTFCQGGSVLVTATPAPGGYSYVWSTTGSTNVGSPNAAVNTISYDGDYSVVITNTTTNCSQTSNAITVTVNDNPTPSIIASDVPATFCVGENVTLTADLSGTNLIYEWTPTGATSQAINVSTSGSYFVTVTNTDNGCFGNSGLVPVIVNPNPIAAIISSVNPPIICQGQTITLQAAPISSSYQWQVQYTEGGSILNIGTNLPSIDVTLSGTYTVTTYNPSGCNTTSIPIDVIVNPIPVPGIIVNGISVAGVAPICQGESVVLSVIGGSFDSYQWYLNDVVLVGETGNTHTATLPGDYTVEVSNGFDCSNFSTPQPVIVNPNPVANINYSGSLDPNQLCPGQTIYLEATPPSMYYSWSSNVNVGISTNMFITTNVGGEYTVEVTDPVTGCSSESLPFNVFVNAINNNSAIVTGLGLSSITLCPGEVYTFSGVNSPDISSFSWVATGGNLTNITSLNPTFTAGSIPGTFPLTLYTTIDYACNTESDSIVVNIVISNSQPTLQHNASSGSTSQSLCTNVGITPITYNVLSGSWGLPNAYVEINGSSTNPYNGISWTFENGIITISGVPTSGFTYNYTVYAVPTIFGCFGDTLSGTITSNVASLSLSTPIFTNNQVICLGDNIQNIVYNYTGIVSSFHLPNGIIASSTTVGNLSTLTLSGTPTEDGYFNYTITTVNICGTENVFGEITIIPAIIGNTSGIDLVVNCNGSAFTLIGGSINLNSIVDYDYLWEYSTSITGPFVPAPGINTNANYTGTMDISNPTLYFRRVITAGNCIDVATPVMVTLNPNGTSTQMLSFAGDDVTISLGETIQLQTNGISISNYSWSPTNSLSDSTISNPFANPTVTTNYTLTVQDIYGCTYSDDIVVNVISDYTLTIPSLITPNGDGSNDFWEIPESLFYPNTSVLIINREGQEVYSSSSYDNTWNGTFEGKLLPEATYYYFIQFSNSEITHKGPITILRNIK